MILYLPRHEAQLCGARRQLPFNSRDVFGQPVNRERSGMLSSLYDPSLQIKMAALNRLAFPPSGSERSVKGKRERSDAKS